MARHPTCSNSLQRKAARSQLQQHRRHLPQACHTSPPPDASTASGGISWHQPLQRMGSPQDVQCLPGFCLLRCAAAAPSGHPTTAGGPQEALGGPCPDPFAQNPRQAPRSPSETQEGATGGFRTRAVETRHHITRPKTGKRGGGRWWRMGAWVRAGLSQVWGGVPGFQVSTSREIREIAGRRWAKRGALHPCCQTC